MHQSFFLWILKCCRISEYFIHISAMPYCFKADGILLPLQSTVTHSTSRLTKCYMCDIYGCLHEISLIKQLHSTDTPFNVQICFNTFKWAPSRRAQATGFCTTFPRSTQDVNVSHVPTSAFAWWRNFCLVGRCFQEGSLVTVVGISEGTLSR